MAVRLLYGLDRLPRTLDADDPRLPGVALGAAPLRLNAVPLPVDAWGANETSGMAAVRAWLLAGCGDYNAALRRGVAAYLDAVTAHVAENCSALEDGLAAFKGLYRVEDWRWSALRPLPRAWWRDGDGWAHADLAFWDGRAVVTVEPGAFDNGLPAAFRDFWRDQVLPVSPFRRPFPAWPVGVGQAAGDTGLR